MAGTDELVPPPPAGRWGSARAAVLVLLACTLLGFPVGLVWIALAPRVPGLVTEEGVVLAVPETKSFIAGDATFLIITIVAGTVCGLLAWAYARRAGARTAVALAVGGSLGALVAEWTGERLTRSSFDDAVAAAELGDTVERFLRLGARGVLVGWPVAALIAFLVLTWRGSDVDVEEEPDAEDRREVSGVSSG